MGGSTTTNTINSSNRIPGRGYGSFFGATSPLRNRASSNVSSIGVCSLPRINSGVNFNYSYSGYDIPYGNSSSGFSNTYTSNKSNTMNNNFTT